MAIRIEDDIKDLMYESSSVVIPGLGAFQGVYKPASTDGIQGVLAPPSLDISFDPNLVINDGVLVDFLKKKYQTTTQEAQKAIDAFIQNAQSTFDKHELFVIPQVGRLYRDHAQRLQFLPENTNFNIDTYGLPIAQFYPVSRTYDEKTAAIDTILQDSDNTLPKTTFPETVESIPHPSLNGNTSMTTLPDWRRYIPFLTMGILAVLAFAIYNHTQKNNEMGYKKAEESIKINEAPPKPVTDIPLTTPPTANVPPPTAEEKPIVNEKMVESSSNSDNSASLSTIPQQTAVVSLGAYADRNNIARHIKWLSANGWEVIEKKNGSVTFLVAKVSYTDKQDLQKTIRKLKGRFGDLVQVKR